MLRIFTKKKLVWGIGVILLAVIAVYYAQPAHKQIKTLRARWLVSDVHYSEYDTSSFSRIRTALQLAPDDLIVLRKACEIYGQLNFTLGYMQWLKLLNHDEVTVADYGLYLDFLIQHQQPLLFRSNAARLSTNVRPDEIKLVLAKYHMAMNNWSLARLLLDKLYTPEAKTGEICYLYGLTILQQGWSSERVRASLLLQESIQLSERYQEEAVRQLIKYRLIKDEELKHILDVLLKNNPDVHQRLLAYQLEASVDPFANEEVLRKILQEYEAAERDEKLEVGRWMNRNSQYAKVVEFIKESETTGDRDLFLVRADAMAAENRWQELEAIFKKEVPLTREIQELFRFRIAHELGKKEVADIFWGRTLELASNKPVLLWYYAGYVSKLSLKDREESVYRSLLSITAHKRSAYLALVELLDVTGQTPKLFQHLTEMKTEYPHDYEVANDWAYCALLLENDIEAAGAITGPALKQKPEVLAFRATHAFYLLKTGQHQQALKLFEGLPLPAYEDWLLEWRVVYLAILQQNQLRDRAAEVLATVPFEQLKVEEARLIRL